MYFYYLSLKKTSKTLLSRNIRNAILYFFCVNFSNEYSNSEFLDTISNKIGKSSVKKWKTFIQFRSNFFGFVLGTKAIKSYFFGGFCSHFYGSVFYISAFFYIIHMSAKFICQENCRNFSENKVFFVKLSLFWS